MELIKSTEMQSYNGVLRVNPDYTAQPNDKPWQKFIHTSGRAGAGKYMYVDMTVLNATGWSDQVSKVGTPIFENSFLWDAFMAEFEKADGVIDMETGSTGRPFEGWFDMVEIDEPIEQWWAGGNNGQGSWNIVDTTRVFVHKVETRSVVHKRAKKYIARRADDPKVTDYRRAQVAGGSNENPEAGTAGE